MRTLKFTEILVIVLKVVLFPLLIMVNPKVYFPMPEEDEPPKPIE